MVRGMLILRVQQRASLKRLRGMKARPILCPPRRRRWRWRRSQPRLMPLHVRVMLMKTGWPRGAPTTSPARGRHVSGPLSARVVPRCGSLVFRSWVALVVAALLGRPLLLVVGVIQLLGIIHFFVVPVGGVAPSAAVPQHLRRVQRACLVRHVVNRLALPSGHI